MFAKLMLSPKARSSHGNSSNEYQLCINCVTHKLVFTNSQGQQSISKVFY